MATLTTSFVTVTNYIINMLQSNQTALGLQNVYYGDQSKINGTPIVCVEPNDKTNNFSQSAASRLLDLDISISIILYTANIQSPEFNREKTDILSETIESLIHSDKNLGGLVIHGYITGITSNYSPKSGQIYRSSRLMYSAISRNLLPS